MVASALTAAGLATTTTVAAATATQTTLSVSKTSAKVDEKVTFTVGLTEWNAATGKYVPLANKDVTLYHTFKGVTYTDVTKKTSANGKFTFSQSFGSFGQRAYYAKFAGDGSYATSTSGSKTVMVKYGTTLSLHAWNIDLPVGLDVTFSGYLKDQNGAPLAHKLVTIYSRKSLSQSWIMGIHAYTDAYGYYSLHTRPKISINEQSTTFYFITRYNGDRTHWNADSNKVAVTWKYGTVLSHTSALIGHANIGQQYSLTGYLKDQYGNPLAGQKIQWYWRIGTSGPWQKGSVGITDRNGYYHDYGIAYQRTTKQYQARYAGDSTHLGAASAIWTVTWAFY